MKKGSLTLTLIEVDALEQEVNGISVHNQKLSRGVLDEELDFTVRYWITRFGKKLKKEAQVFRDLRDDLIKKFGKEDPKNPGRWSIPRFVKQDGEDIPNPDLLQYDKAVEKISSQELTISEAPIFSLEELNFRTSGNYALFLLNNVEVEGEPEVE